MNIFQIYHDKKLIPDYVGKHIRKMNPDYNYVFIDFNEGINMIINDFKEEELKDRILYCLNTYPRYCHRSDLLRYCLLYIYGGVYIDIDLKPLISFDDIKKNGVDFITSFGRAGNAYFINNIQIYPVTSNGILICKSKNPILLDLIKNTISNEKLFSTNPEYRGEIVFYLYNYLNHKCKENNIILKPFEKLNINNQIIYMFNHIILKNKMDVIVDNNSLIIHSNDCNYNFKRQTSSFL
tara:strand:- start:4660 stop:5373 length:714 start_codon:yes stop_codon:yes gene_type:complete